MIVSILHFQWDMICEAPKVESTQSIYMFGVMIGSSFMGGLGDRFGRFPVLFGCQILTSIFAFISSFATGWIGLAALR